MDDTPVKGPLHEYEHSHPPVVNVAELHNEGLGLGQRVADRVAAVVGSWPFIIVQSCLLMIWIGINIYFALNPGALKAFDPYPFILLNLALSFQAAYTGPIVMMSQNRQAEKDRMTAQNDFQVNQVAEEEIRIIMEHLKHQDELILGLSKQLERIQNSGQD